MRRPGAPPRPPLLTLMAFFVSLFALVFILLFLVAALGGGPYFVSGEPATRDLPAPLGPARPARRAGRARIWRDRRWSRPALVVFRGCFFAGGIAADAVHGSGQDVSLALPQALSAGAGLG